MSIICNLSTSMFSPFNFVDLNSDVQCIPICASQTNFWSFLFQDKYDEIEKNVTFDITQNNVSKMCPEKIVGHIANTYFWSH